MSETDTTKILSGVSVGDQLFVRRREGRAYRHSVKIVTRISGPVVVAKGAATSRTGGVTSFRISDGLEQSGNARPARARPMDQEAHKIMEMDNSNRRGARWQSSKNDTASAPQ